MNRRLTLLATAVLACAAGVLRIWAADTTWDGALLAGAGLVLLGVWLCLEVLDDKEDKK